MNSKFRKGSRTYLGFSFVVSGSLLGWVSPRWPAIGSFLSRLLTNGRAAEEGSTTVAAHIGFFSFLLFALLPLSLCGMQKGWMNTRQTNSMACQVSFFFSLFFLFLVCFIFYLLKTFNFFYFIPKINDQKQNKYKKEALCFVNSFQNMLDVSSAIPAR